MKPKPPRLNVPEIVKQHGITVWKDDGKWCALLMRGRKWHQAYLFPSKRKAVIDVLKQAGIQI